MKKTVDTKFFEFIGINVTKSAELIKVIEQYFGIKSIFEVSEDEIRSKCIKYLQKAFFQNFSDTPILQDVILHIQNISVYDNDIDTALYMLVGSWYSKWTLETETYERLPFSIIYNNKMKYQSLWCNAFKTIFGNLNKRSLLSPIDNKTRLAKYSYLNMKELEHEIEESITYRKMQYEDNEKDKDELTLLERENLKYNFFMSQDGIENLILYDWIFGLSFAEICYVHTSKILQKNMERMEKVIECLAEIKGCHIKNELADILLPKLLLDEMKEEVFEQVMYGLENIVKAVNTVYYVSLQHAWEIFKKTEGSNILENWREIVFKNAYGVFVPSNHAYSQKVYKDICYEKKISYIGNPKDSIQLLDAIKNHLIFMESVPTGLTDKQLEKINSERKKDNDIRGDFKKIKTKSELYMKIQSIIIKRQIMGNFPTFL